MRKIGTLERFNLRGFFLLVCVFAAAWFATRPYLGVTRDARLYIAQAYKWLGGNDMENDMFFQFGSQDSYTVFSPIYAPVVGAVGPGSAHFIFAILGMLLWIGSVLFLCKAIFGTGRVARLSALAVFVLMPFYGWQNLQYSESFVSSRMFAEPMALFAFAFAINRQVLGWAGAILISAVLHPLMALPVLLSSYLIVFQINRWTVSALVGGSALFVVLAWMGFDPFNRLFETVDQVWFQIMYDRIPQLFMEQWGAESIFLTLLPVASMLIVMMAGEGKRGAIAAKTVLVTILFLVAAWIGGGILKNLLLLNLQLWRSLWVFMVLGNLFAVYAWTLLPKKGLSRQLFTQALAINVFENVVGFLPFVSGALAFFVVVTFSLERTFSGKVPAVIRYFIGIIGLLIVAFLMLEIYTALAITNDTRQLLKIVYTLALLVLAAHVLFVWDDNDGPRNPLLLTVSIAVVIVAFSSWDQRNNYVRYVENGDPVEAEVDEILTGDQIYWEGELRMLWIKMRRSSYYSCQQAAGLMFNRETALEHERRSVVLKTLNVHDFADELYDYCHLKKNPETFGPSTSAQLVQVCIADPDLDQLVLHRKVPEAKFTKLEAPAPFAVIDGIATDEDAKEKGVEVGDHLTHFETHYFVYNCSDFRGEVGMSG